MPTDLENTIGAYVEAMAPVFQRMADQFAAALAQMQPAIEAIYAELGQEYRAEGAPYGDTTEGLHRWMADLAARRGGSDRRRV